MEEINPNAYRYLKSCLIALLPTLEGAHFRVGIEMILAGKDEMTRTELANHMRAKNAQSEFNLTDFIEVGIGIDKDRKSKKGRPKTVYRFHDKWLFIRSVLTKKMLENFVHLCEQE